MTDDRVIREDKDKKEFILRETSVGTVTRSHWDEKYYEQVIEKESEARRAICAAPTKSGTPCKGVPNSEFNYYCRIHKDTGVITPTPERTTHGITTPREHQPVLLNDEIRLNLGSCSICTQRNSCSEYIPNHHCRIEERIAHQLIDTIIKDYQIDQLDMFMVVQAALAWIGGWRARLAQVSMRFIEAEESKVTWAGPREDKNYREIMKHLGLTRKERIDQEHDRGRSSMSGVPINATLADIMSQLSATSKVTIAQAVKIEPRDDRSDLDILADVIDEETSKD